MSVTGSHTEDEPNWDTDLVFGGISGSFGLTWVFCLYVHPPKYQPCMVPTDSPDMPRKLTKKVRFGIKMNLNYTTPDGRECFTELARQLTRNKIDD